MNIFALDLGTKTGWALICNGLVKSGIVNFATTKLAGYGLRFLNFRNWLAEMLEKHGVELVVFEDVRAHAGVFAAHAYGGFMAQLASVCEERRIPYRGFGVKTIKKFITGNGNAGKQNVIDALQTKGYRPVDDNEADAIALALLAESELIKENKAINLNLHKQALASSNPLLKSSCTPKYTPVLRCVSPCNHPVSEGFEKDLKNSDCKNTRINIYSASLGLVGHEIKNRNYKYNKSHVKAFVGPFKYSQVTGKSIAASPHRQKIFQS
jgi:Holliday junction resolvasome RuvABC endonuclease subunit